MSAERLIVVTGGAGHVGSHVIEALVKDPLNKVVSLDNYSNGSTDNHIPGAEYREGHTKDIELHVTEEPSAVFHLGEYGRIAPSFVDVRTVFEQNTVGTFAVAEFAKVRGSRLVYAGSSTRFAADGEGRHQNPYSFTKAVNVDLINDYGKWYGLDYAIAYFNNAYGPRERGDDQYGTLVARFQRAHLRGQPLQVVRPGTQRRNFTHVSDLARGLILVGERGEGDGYVLGDSRSYSVQEIAEAFGGPIEYQEGYPGRDRSGEAPTRARDELGWDVTVGVLDYIKDFVERHPRGSGRSAE